MKLREVATGTRQDALFYKERAERFEREIADLERKLAECAGTPHTSRVRNMSHKAQIEMLQQGLAECEAEREAAQKRFEAASELSAARGVEISELRERIAECERKNKIYLKSIFDAEEAAEAAGRPEGEYLAHSIGYFVQLWQEAERKLAAAMEALQAYRNFKPFDWRFDHSGAMNATQLGEHDVYVKIRAKADKVLAALTEAGEEEK